MKKVYVTPDVEITKFEEEIKTAETSGQLNYPWNVDDDGSEDYYLS